MGNRDSCIISHLNFDSLLFNFCPFLSSIPNGCQCVTESPYQSYSHSREQGMGSRKTVIIIEVRSSQFIQILHIFLYFPVSINNLRMQQGHRSVINTVNQQRCRDSFIPKIQVKFPPEPIQLILDVLTVNQGFDTIYPEPSLRVSLV